MKIHHLNCGSFCPLIGSGTAVSHCLLIETQRAGLVLVDTGIGHAVTQAPSRHMSWMNRLTLRPRFHLAESALIRVEALGYTSKDVRHIVLTHLDPDHAGGLQDFPDACVHVHEDELAAASNRRADPRYTPRLWSHGVHWKTYREQGDTWCGFQSVNQLADLDEEIALVPLVGHTGGHCGVAVRRDSVGWLLHAGDAYLQPQQIHSTDRPALGLRLAAWLTTIDREQRRHNEARLRSLVQTHARDVEVFCAHSSVEFDALRSSLPAHPMV